MSKCTIVILAAGIGSRYGGLKQAEPIGPNGELIIHYSVYDAIRAGFDQVRDLGQQLRGHSLPLWQYEQPVLRAAGERNHPILHDCPIHQDAR